MSELKGTLPTVVYEDGLYLAEPAAILALVREVPQTAKTVMVVGHNPGLHALALELTGRGERKLIGAMAREFSNRCFGCAHVRCASVAGGRHGARYARALHVPKTPRDALTFPPLSTALWNRRASSAFKAMALFIALVYAALLIGSLAFLAVWVYCEWD